MLIVPSDHAHFHLLIFNQTLNHLSRLWLSYMLFFEANQETHLTVDCAANNGFTLALQALYIFPKLVETEIDFKAVHELQVTAIHFVHSLRFVCGAYRRSYSAALHHLKILQTEAWVILLIVCKFSTKRFCNWVLAHALTFNHKCYDIFILEFGLGEILFELFAYVKHITNDELTVGQSTCLIKNDSSDLARMLEDVCSLYDYTK